MKLSNVVVCAVALSVACGGAPEPGKTAAPAAPVGPAAKSGAPASVVEAGDFGVPECDAYFKKYLACIDAHVPEQAKGMMKQAMEQTRAGFKQAASTPQGKAGLVRGCSQAMAAAKQAMTAYSCSWWRNNVREPRTGRVTQRLA